MKQDKQSIAKDLYFQTNLKKTEIAQMLDISRRTLHYWIRQGNWDRLRSCAEHMPSLIVENLYHGLDRLTKSFLGESRIMRPITRSEAETVYKLTLAIGKLKNRSSLNEDMENFAFLLEGIRKTDPKLAEAVLPHVDRHLHERAGIYAKNIQPATFDEHGFLPVEKPDNEEEKLDMQDIFAWSTENEKPLVSQEDIDKITPEELAAYEQEKKAEEQQDEEDNSIYINQPGISDEERARRKEIRAIFRDRLNLLTDEQIHYFIAQGRLHPDDPQVIRRLNRAA